MFEAGIDLGVRGLNKEGVKVGRDLKREETVNTIFLKEEAAAGDFGNTWMNEKFERKETEKDNQIKEEAAKNGETRGPKEKRKLPCDFCDYKTGKTSHL